MEPEVIWIGIDPSLLIEGFDYQGFFGSDSFLKFNINPDETDGNDNEAGNTNDDETNLPIAKSDGLEATFNSDVKNEKFKSEFDPDLDPTAQSTAKSIPKQSQTAGIPSVCSECGLAFNSMAKLEEHVRVVHKTNLRFPCDHCDKMFSRKYLLEHKRFVVEGKQLNVSCKICDQMFMRKRDLEAHISKVHPEEVVMPHQCNICLKVLRSSETLRYHERQNHRESVAQCEICSKKFSIKKNYDFHMLQAFCDPSKRKKEKQCDKCEMTFRRKCDLDCHIDSRHSDREYHCKSEGCDKVVTSYRKLKYHMMDRHSEENISCAICHRKFASESSRDVHVKSESCKIRIEKKREAARNGEFKCSFEKCEKQYLTKTHLDRHTMIHTNERPYQCDNCGMAFHQKGSLKEHMRLHTGEKPYQCQVCPNAYAQGGTFKAHLKTHIDGNSVDKREVKTFKSKRENFRDYYLKRTFLGTTN